MGKSTVSTMFFLKKCLVFHVTKAVGLVAMALARIDASEVGSKL